MSQKNETPVLVLSLLITLGLVGAGAWWFTSRLDMGNILPSTQTNGSPNSNSSSSNTVAPGSVQERLSSGDRLLIADGASPEKEAGIRAIAAGNYAQAIADLETVIESNRNDPEALIYLNNARIGTQPSYAIAVSVPAGGSVNPALEILRGVAQAQTQINQAGGINGVPLQVIIADDGGDTATSQQVAEALVSNPNILGVIGHFGSDATLAAGPVYEAGQLVVISPTSTSTRISELGNYVFRTVPSDRFTAAALSRYTINTLQLQNVAIYFNSASDYSQSLKEEFTTALYGDGGQIVAEFDLSSNGFNAADSLNQSTQQDAQVLMLASNTATLDQALQVVAVNRNSLQLLGGDSVYNPKTLQVGGAAAEGMVVAVPWHILSDPNTDFVRTSRQLWGGDVNWRTAMAYDAAQALIAGLESNPTRTGVQQALAAGNFSTVGATGTIRFLPSGDRNQAAQLVIVEPGTRSGYGYDFTPVP